MVLIYSEALVKIIHLYNVLFVFTLRMGPSYIANPCSVDTFSTLSW